MTPDHFIPDRPPRLVCGRCRRPQSTCVCHWVTPVEPIPEVLILQHPLESRQAKGSALLLHLSLKGSRLVTGETFGGEELQRLLHAPFESVTGAETQTAVSGAGHIRPILLYPDSPHKHEAGDAAETQETQEAQETPLTSARGGTASIPPRPCRLRLVVLDGTWRKSRKLLFLNPALRELPRMSLQQVSPSRYRIRKAHAPDQLSTLEATCQALAQLEGDQKKYLPLLQAFDGFVEEQLSRVPSSRQ